MDADLWARAVDVFLEAVEVEGPERESILERTCEGSPELRDLVDRLLAGDVDQATLLDQGPGALAQVLAPPEENEPTRIGPYRVTRELGRGGMGTVYLAERADGRFDRTVAIKVVRGGWGDPRTVERFRSEVQILAGLEHPGIARLYDAELDEQRPYLVMEYVRGRRIDRFCDDRGMTPRQRIELFRDVCAAVQFAHQHLVIHRDLKPSNVMVSEEGGVKLLDFGIARLVEDTPAGDTTVSPLAFTPEYASPEQLVGRTPNTASDVFSLGVVLYEMLTGHRPFDVPAGDLVALAERAHTEPPAPSSVVTEPVTVRRPDGSTETITPDEVASRRGIDTETLRRQLRGDLDHILMKALRSDPGARYATVEALSADLGRYLEGRPVSARADSFAYRAKKYVGRHRAGVAAAAVAVAAVIGFGAIYTTGITRERDLAEDEAVKAQTTTRFLQRLLGDAYPSVALGDTFSMGELLSRAVVRVDSLDDQPEIQAELLRTLGDVYREQGRFEEALPLLERSVSLHRSSGGPMTPEVAQALSALGHMHHEAHDYEAARQVHRESLEAAEAIYEPDDSLVLYALNNLAAAAQAIGDYEEAIAAYEAILSRHDRLFADTSQLVIVTRGNRGQLYHAMGDYAAAEAELGEALRLKREVFPAMHPSTALTLNNLGAAIERQGRLEEAEAVHREALDMFRQVFGPDHHRVGMSAYNLATALRLQGRLEEADSLYRLTLAIDRQTFGEEHEEVGRSLRAVGRLAVEREACDEAVNLLTDADRILQDNERPVTHRWRLTTRASLATCLIRMERYAEADALLLAGVDSLVVADAEADSAALAETLESLDSLNVATGRDGTGDSIRAVLGVSDQ